jgi:hypothetical protein
MKNLVLAVLLLLAVPLKADTLFSNMGDLSSPTYRGDQYTFAAGFSDTFWYFTATEFTPTRDYSGSLNLFLPAFALSTGSAPNGLDSNNFPAFVLSLTANPAEELWRSGPLFPTWILNGDGTINNRCCDLFHTQTGDVTLNGGQQYVLTMLPYAVNSTDLWYLSNNDGPGLIVTTATVPEPATAGLVLLGIALIGTRRLRKGKYGRP